MHSIASKCKKENHLLLAELFCTPFIQIKGILFPKQRKIDKRRRLDQPRSRNDVAKQQLPCNPSNVVTPSSADTSILYDAKIYVTREPRIFVSSKIIYNLATLHTVINQELTTAYNNNNNKKNTRFSVCTSIIIKMTNHAKLGRCCLCMKRKRS